MYEFAETTVNRHSGNKAKTKLYSQLFIVSTVEAETMSNSLRKFSELHKFMNFLCENFRCLWQDNVLQEACETVIRRDGDDFSYFKHCKQRQACLNNQQQVSGL